MLNNKCPKLSVVIPTRERADTLIHTLRTVTTQAYDNLEIIVSDNASEDSTKEIVNATDDKRIKYTNTGKRCGMSDNWEHGLSLVTGDYVMFLGDDDGLLPNACADVAEILVATGTKAVIWNKPDYTWPSVKRLPNALFLENSYGLVEMRGDILLKEIAAGRTSYGRLPVIYSGFVSMSSIAEIKSQTGKFFQCVTPDVYSGIVLAQNLQTYIYSMRPFSINGGSQHSNGISQAEPGNKLAKRFFAEANHLNIDKEFQIIPGSISSCVAEAFSQAQRRMLVGGNNLNRKRYYRNICQELISQPLKIKLQGLKILINFDLPKKLKEKVQVYLDSESGNEYDEEYEFREYKDPISSRSDGVLKIACDNFDVKNSYDACQLVGNILGMYHMPSNIVRADYPAYLILVVRRKIAFYFRKYFLPF